MKKIEIPVQNRKDFLNKVINYNKQRQNIKLPYTNKLYTLILDLDDTLVSQYQEGEKIKIIERPYLKDFLSQVSKDFEIVIFTSAEQSYADQIIDKIDPQNQYFAYRLYRENMDLELKIKDLQIISNRKLESVLIVDDIEQNFQKQKENGYLIEPFTLKQENFISNDNELIKLMYVLDEIMEQKPGDVREILKNSKEIIQQRQFQQVKMQSQKNFSHLKIQDTRSNDNFKIGALQIQIETPPSDCSNIFSNCSPDNLQGQNMVSVKCHTIPNNLQQLPSKVIQNDEDNFTVKFANNNNKNDIIQNNNKSRKRIESLVTASQRTSENSNFSSSIEEQQQSLKFSIV